MTTPIDPHLVAPLVWESDAPMGGFWFTAVSAVGIYRVREAYTGAVAWQFGTMGKWHEAATIEAAKAAVQADYATHVIATLNPTALAAMLEEARNGGIRDAAGAVTLGATVTATQRAIPALIDKEPAQ
jgi:hypothetical protein